MIFTENYQLWDHSKFAEAFIGANTAHGFKGMTNSIISEESMKRIYVIKGAAGTGKSTLLKKIYNTATRNGIYADRYACSSDPNSLDMVVINSQIAVLDGTAPHTYDMLYPGTSSSMIDLSKFWNNKKLENYKTDIIGATKFKNSMYSHVYSKLHVIQMLFKERFEMIASVINNEKLERFVSRLADDICHKEVLGSTVYEYHRCISTKGRIRLNTSESKADYIYRINDFYGSAYVFTDCLEKHLKNRGIYHLVSIDPLDSNIISEIFIPKKNILITVEQIDKSDKVINMKRFISTDKFALIKGEIRLSKKCAMTMDEEVLTYIRKAGIAHCELEAMYSECMDYESLNEYTDYICCEILENFN